MEEIKIEYYFKNLDNFEHREIFEDCTYPWEVLAKTKEYLKEKLAGAQINKAETAENCTFKGNYFIDEGTKIYPNVIIQGPVYIGKNCEIMPGAYVRPGTITGDNVVIGFNSEVKNSVLQNGCKVASLVFVGDSILGKSARIGSGVVTANRRFDQGNINVKVNGEVYETKSDYCGVIVGDNSRLGANVTTLPGTLIGPYTWILPGLQVRGFVPAEKRLLPKTEYIIQDNPRMELK